MSLVNDKITNILISKNLSRKRLAALTDVHCSSLSQMINGKRNFSEDVIPLIAPILEVPPEKIKGWIAADKYPKTLIEKALDVSKTIEPEEDTFIITHKIDEILKQKGISSRTEFSEIIGYNQGKLNRMIIGKEPVSPLLLSKLAPALGVSEDDIRSWAIADEYEIVALEEALRCG